MTKRLPPLSRRRPKRQRNPTTLYTDDNPSTFTTKKKKGSLEPDDTPPPPPPPPEKPKPKYFFVEESLPLKRQYRKKKSIDKSDSPLPSPRVVSDDTTSTTVPEISDMNTPPVKRKRGRPPSKKKMLERQLAAQRLSVGQQQTKPTTTLVEPSLAPTLNRSPSKAILGTTSWTPPMDDAVGTFLSHPITAAPILPPTQLDKNPLQNLEQKYPSIFGNGLGIKTPLDEPKWSPLYCPDVYFEDDYESDENRRLDASVLPVTRSITCVTTRRPDNQYMAVGDSAGFCIIYSMGPHIRPVARLETVACQQRAREEQEKIREQKLRKKGKLRSLVMDTSQTTIHALGMIGTRVVLATACELECMDVPSQTSLWVCPLSADRIVTSLDMHMSTYDVLVSCSLYQHTQTDAPRNATTPLATSPLMLLQHSENNVEICDANSPILLKSPCCTAMWDASTTSESRLLFVAVSDTENELELVLVQGGSIDSWKVACKTKIPVKASNHQTKLCQSPAGLYTLVATSRGIRLYDTETLQLIHVYGDNLALHGKSVVWQDCLLLGKPNLSHKPSRVTNKNIEYDDWLQNMEEDDKERKEGDLGLFVIGVPNFKGPKELCETLHVWRTEQPNTVPAVSIPLPPKSDGVQGLVPAPPTIGGDRIVLSTRSGQGYVLIPRAQSNFAGIMYPAGYRIIDDNIEIIEDEDELDVVDVAPKEPEEEEEEDEEDDIDVLVPDDEEEMDEDLKEALRQSLLEQKRQKEKEAVEDTDVDILGPVPDKTEELLIPCRPEAYLKQAVNNQDDMDSARIIHRDRDCSEDSPGEQSLEASNIGPLFISNFLESMPNIHKKKPASSNELGFTVTAKIAVVANPIQNRPGRGKRSRAASLEAVLKASIDPHLQRFMISKQGVWSDGSRSKLNELPESLDYNAVDFVIEDDRGESISGDIVLENTSMVSKDGEIPSTHVSPQVTLSRSASNGGETVSKIGENVVDFDEFKSHSSIVYANGNCGSKTAEVVLCTPKDKIFEPKERSNQGSPEFVGKNGEIADIKNCTPKLCIQSDEAVVALGLLGLSPCDNSIPSDSSSSEASPSEKVQLPSLNEETKNDVADASSYLNASLQRANLSTNVMDSVSTPSSKGSDRIVYPKAESSVADTSDRGSIIADTSSEIASSSAPGSQVLNGKCGSCYACRGRHVLHTCGKRALPIDFDEVAKAEREKKIKEEEEKKKVRAEKRRQADARRREAKKQKEIEERRRREEEHQRLERERQKRMEENSNGNVMQVDMDQKRREMIVASYVDYTASHPSTEWSPRDQPSVAMTTVNYNPQVVQPSHEYVASPVVEKTPVAATTTTTTHYVGYAKAETYAAPQPGFQPSGLAINGRQSSRGTLSSADALVALANLSASSPPSHQLAPEPPKQPETQSYTYASNPAPLHHGATHGFSTSLTTTTESTASIPSYASIRGQANGISSSFISYKGTATNAGATYTWQAAPAVDRASEYYTERYYNPVTGKEYTSEEKASFRTA